MYCTTSSLIFSYWHFKNVIEVQRLCRIEFQTDPPIALTIRIGIRLGKIRKIELIKDLQETFGKIAIINKPCK